MENLPEAFKERMKTRLREQYPAFEASYHKTPMQGLRLNLLKEKKEEIKKACSDWFHLTPVPWAENGFFYSKGERPGKHPYHEAGLYYIQEPSAMAVVSYAKPRPGDFVLDLCAAPGGKSTQIAAFLQGEGLLISNEIHPVRAKILSQNIERLGISNAVVTNEDAKSLAGWLPAFFDLVFADAPCSGEGMFRKDETARKEWSLEAVNFCAARQEEILAFAAQTVKPGGLLVYSTCTFSPEENEGSLEKFLQTHPEFFVEQREHYPGFDRGHPEWSGGRKELIYTCRLWPHQIEGEGHYFAALRKKKDGLERGETEKFRDKKKKLDKEKEQIFSRFCKETLTPVRPWEEKPGQYLLFGDQLYYAPFCLPEIKGKKILRPGLHLGNFKKNRFEPSHALALFLKKDQGKNQINFSSRGEEIIRYLRGESLNIRSDSIKPGWILVSVDGFSLGWAKAAGGRLNNHYPKGLRWMEKSSAYHLEEGSQSGLPVRLSGDGISDGENEEPVFLSDGSLDNTENLLKGDVR